MSKIDKLNVIGIRSFSNEGRGETIQFDTPLTLIVGHNGSGKTTIIECLKYATTGQMPPNSKGGAFIHDPTLCGEKEVLGQVKLQFKNMDSSTLTLSRSVSLTLKKATRAMKTLDSTLSIKQHGERTVISSTVAQLDKLMQEQLGVSEAVLDYVIFCHQDESLWPMSEPAALKKRFDEIFEAGQYTKAIDKIKKMRKAQAVELAKHKLQEQHTKVMKDKAEKSEKRSVALSEEIEKLRAQADAVMTEMEEAKASAKQKREEAQGYLGIVLEIKNKRLIQEERQKNIDELKPHLKKLSDSDDSLRASLAQYEDRMARCEQELAQHTQQVERLSKLVLEYRKQHSEKLAQQGKLMAEKDNYERQLRLRVDLVHDSASKHRIRGYEGNLEDYQISDFIDKIAKAVRDKRRELTRVEEESSEASEKAAATLREIENRMASQKGKKNSARQLIEANDAKIKTLQRNMDVIEVDEGRKAVLDTSCQQLETRLRTANSEFKKAEWDSNMDKERTRENDLDAKIRKLTDEQTRINRLATERGRYEQVEKQLNSKEKGLETMTATYGNRITAAIGANWKPETLDEEFKSIMKDKSNLVAKVRSRRDGTAAELSHVDEKCKVLREKLDRKMTERKSCEKQVIDSMEELTSIEDYDAQFADLKQAELTVKMDIENFGHVKNFWAKAMKNVEKKNKCMACEHSFSGEQEKSVAINYIQKQLMDDPREAWGQDLKVIEEQIAKAERARPRYEDYKHLTDEIPTVQGELKQTQAKREEVVARLEKQDLSVEEAEAIKGDLEALEKPITNIARYTKDISEFKKTLEGLSSQPEISSSMSIEEIRTQLEQYDGQMRAIKTQIESLRVSKERALKEIFDLELKLRDARRELADATHQIEKKNGLAQQVRERKDNNSDLRETIKQAEKDLDTLSPQADKAREELEDVRRTGQGKEQRIRTDLTTLVTTDSELKRANNEIDAYIQKGGSDRLTECEQSIRVIDNEIQQREQESSQVKKATMDLREQVAHGEESKRNINDNLNYRKNLADLKVLNTEIAQLEAMNAREDYDRLDAEAEAFEKQSQILNANRSTMFGQIRAKDEELGAMVEEWSSDFKDAGSNYREAHIKVETTKAAIEDLGKYGSALDQAIMKYHSLKMEEINRIAGELWQSTYQGTDVDKILIRSDHENSKGNRNYNYRVCMVKSDVEMDMRGRCSAGQRVLASIIIRLALAECFGVNCGIIALDEPTTNLDQDNIRSLAQSLHDIIEVRRVQKNFQLIVITHDEEFLKAMKCDSFCDNYWRVSRNDSQNSIIRMQSIKEVLG